MYVTDRFEVHPNDEIFSYLEENSRKAKLLYNAALFRVRNHFTAANKLAGGEKLTPNEQSVEDELSLLKKDVNTKVLSVYTLQKLMVCTHNPDYYAGLPSQIAQHVVARAAHDFRSWLKALSDYRKHPEKYTGKPKMPHYKEHPITSFVMPNQTTTVKDGIIHFPKTKATVPCRKRPGAKLIEVKASPYYGNYMLSVTYEILDAPVSVNGNHTAAIDFGVDNIMAVVSDDGSSVLFEGGAVKAANQFFNKEKARLVSAMTKGHETTKNPTSKRLNSISRHRDAFLRDEFHKMSKRLVEWCLEHEVSTLVLGVNKGWKQNADIGRRNNQTFVSIPFDKLRKMIKFKAESVGITIIEQEESYTSKASFIDRDEIPVYGEEETAVNFSGHRNHRGLYMSKDGIVLNADLNGAANILRKSGVSCDDVDLQYLMNPKVIGHKQINTCIPDSA